MNNQMILLLFLYMMDKTNSENQIVHNLKNYISGIEIDLEYTQEKIQAFKKVAPLISTEYNQPFIKSIIITENVIKLLELKSSFNQSNHMIQSNIVPIEDKKERMSKIITTLQEEMPKSKIKNMGMIMDLVVNMDEYKKMFELLNTFMSNKDSMNDPENMIKLMSQFTKGKGQKGKTNPKDMEQILNIIKVLNAPEKKEKKEEKSKA